MMIDIIVFGCFVVFVVGIIGNIMDETDTFILLCEKISVHKAPRFVRRLYVIYWPLLAPIRLALLVLLFLGVGLTVPLRYVTNHLRELWK